MSGNELASDQPKVFEFSEENQKLIEGIIAKYPEGRQASAVIPLLDIAQRQHENWLPKVAIEKVAEILDMAPIRVLEVATFYTMFNLKPVGRHFLQVCKTTPCWLRGSDNVLKCISDKLGISNGETSSDGLFTLLEVECLGACVNAPIIQINDDFYEDLDYETTSLLLDKLRSGESTTPGSVIGRNQSENIDGATTLTSLKEAGGVVPAFSKTIDSK